MNINKLIKDLEFNGESSKEKIIEVERESQINFPNEYKEFMIRYNGGEGEIGEYNYIVIWPIEELNELNVEYGVEEFAPGLYLFGSDGGNVAYAFDTRQERMLIVEVPFIGMTLEEVKILSDTFNGFLEYLYKL